MATTAEVTIAVNVGSSSLKCAAFSFEPAPRLLDRSSFAATRSSLLPVEPLLTWLAGQSDAVPIAAIGHRVVHGGPMRSEPQRITDQALIDLARLVPFAPNHLPHEIAMIEALRRRFPRVPQVACFDTAFHQSLPDVARRLPIPAVYDALGIRRYGFHGLSYTFLLEELRRVAGADAANGSVVLAHLGNGSSLAAVREGRSVDTTMAFTPLSGVVMGTRSGDIDPGVISYLARHEKLSPDQIEDLLSRGAGLLGISRVSGDMRTLLDREQSDEACRLAVAVYVYSIQKAIGALAAALGGLDTLVFAGGIGERAAVVRARICHRFAFLGLQLDAALNQAHAPVISSPASRVTARVIATDEELMIARAVYRVLAAE